jgi:hypothetical protein
MTAIMMTMVTLILKADCKVLEGIGKSEVWGGNSALLACRSSHVMVTKIAAEARRSIFGRVFWRVFGRVLKVCFRDNVTYKNQYENL